MLIALYALPMLSLQINNINVTLILIDAAEVNMAFVGFGFFNVVLMVILKTKVGYFLVLTISNFNQLYNILFMLLKGEKCFQIQI